VPLRILLVDDHRIIRAGIKAILERSREFAVVGEAENGLEAVALCSRLHPDVVVMDIGLPGTSGIEITQLIVRSAPETKIIMLSIHADEQSVVAAIQSGARGYVIKNASGRDLVEAVRTVANGESYLSPQVSRHLLSRVQRGGPEPTPASLALESLTPRESQVFRLIAAGNNSKAIAVTLNLGLGTVLTYRKQLMKKLQVSSVAALTKLAVVTGVIDISRTPTDEDADPRPTKSKRD